MVAFIHRDSYYNRDETGEEGPQSQNKADKAEIIIAKQRNGPTGSVYLGYFSEWTRFEDLAPGSLADGY